MTEDISLIDEQMDNDHSDSMIQETESEFESSEHTETSVLPAETNQATKIEPIRYTKLPIARIKSIMKMDPDLGLASSDAVFLVTKATELFLETIGKEAYSYTSKNKRKTVSKKDLDTVIETVDCLCFLEGALDF